MADAAGSEEEIAVKGMMHLLVSYDDGGKSGVNLRETGLQVYHNFTCIYQAAFEEGKVLSYLLTLCRCSLMVIIQEEEGSGNNRMSVNRNLCDLLADIESYFLNLNRLSSFVPFHEMSDLMARIVRAYLAIYSDDRLYNHQPIGDDEHLMTDFCNRVHSDLSTLRTYTYLRSNIIGRFSYLNRDLVAKMRRSHFHGEDLKEMLISIQSVVQKLACFSFLLKFCKEDAILSKDYEMVRDRIVSDVDVGVFRVMILVLQGDVSAGLSTDEFLPEYVNYLRRTIELLKYEATVDLAGVHKNEIYDLSGCLRLLKHLFMSVGHQLRTLHCSDSEQEKLSGMMVCYKTLLGNVGSFVHSCLNQTVDQGSICSVLSDLIKNVKLMLETAIEAIFCIILQRMDEYLIESQPALFMYFLINLKVFMDHKYGLRITGHKETDDGSELRNVRRFVFLLAESIIGELTPGEVTEHVDFTVSQIDHVVLGDASFVLHEGLFFLKSVLVSHSNPIQLDSSKEDKLAAIRVQYKELLGNIGSVIYSSFKNPVKRGIISVLAELVEKVELIQEEAIEAIFFLTLQRMDEYLIESRPELFIIIIENLKVFMNRKCGLTVTGHKESDDGRGFRIVKTLVCLLAKSIIGELSTGEVLTEYVKFAGDRTGQAVNDAPIVLFEGILFVKCVLMNHSNPIQLDSFMEEKLTAIRVEYKVMLENIGSVIYSYFKNPVKGSISSVLTELIEKVEVIQEETIGAIFSTVLGRMGEYLIESTPDFFIVFLENIKEFMDRKSGLTITEHKESGGGIGLLKVKAFVLQLAKSTTGELRVGEILTEYVKSVQGYEIEQPKDEAVDLTGYVAKDQSKVLHDGVLFLNSLLISHGHPLSLQYGSEEMKLSAVRVPYRAFPGNIDSFIHSYFCNQRNGSISCVLPNLIENVHATISLVVLNSIGQECPRTDQLGFLNLLLENYWKELMDCESDLIKNWMDQIQTIHNNLLHFRYFIQNTTLDEDDDDTCNLFKRMTGAGYAAEYLLNSFAIKACPIWCRSPWISELMEHGEQIKTDMEINKKKANGKNPRNDKDLRGRHSHVLVPTADNVMVGFEEEKKLIMGRLLAFNVKQLDVVSIIGMGGLGKTTLAKKVYEDPASVSHFDVRAWCCVSQEYNKKDLFLSILSSIIELNDLTMRKSEADLSLMVHKELTGRRYLIVVDDVWAMDAFMGLKLFFPGNGNGSRIVLTSRNIEIGLGTKCHSNPIELRFLTIEESWHLLECRIYGGKGNCPPELSQVGQNIANKCKGLPLAVVVVAGFLTRSEQKRDFWEQVAENLSLYLASDPEKQWTGALELSYKYLPDSMKPLFLYLGAFPEDKEIPADKLTWLWIAEGLVHKTEFGSSEHQAETCLMDLIGRSLVMVSKRKSDGRVKSCHIHDLLRDMCLAKAKEENFMHQVYAYNVLSDPIIFQRRLSIFLTSNGDDGETSSSGCPLISYDYLPTLSITPPLRTFLFFNRIKSLRPLSKEATKSVFSILKLLRVLHSESTTIDDDVYNDLTRLVYLRYMSIRTSCNIIPSSISSLVNLDSLLIKGVRGEMVVPETIWEMVKLRHLHIDPRFRLREAPDNSSKLESLETLSTPAIDLGEEFKLIRKVPNLQKLRCVFTESKYNSLYRNIYQFPDLESLDKLESLKMSYHGQVKLSGQFKLPSNLKKLSISTFRLQWNQVHLFQNVEILKLCFGSVQGEFWDTGEDNEFPNLRVLKLEKLNIKRWEASDENFPQLEKLVLERCKQLEEIPSGLGDICTLERIEVLWCNSSTAKSAKSIQEEQAEKGNESIKVHIYPPELGLRKKSENIRV